MDENDEKFSTILIICIHLTYIIIGIFVVVTAIASFMTGDYSLLLNIMLGLFMALALIYIWRKISG